MLCYGPVCGPDGGPVCGPVCGPDGGGPAGQRPGFRLWIYKTFFFFWFKLTLLVALVTSAVLVSVTVQSFLISCLSCWLLTWYFLSLHSGLIVTSCPLRTSAVISGPCWSERFELLPVVVSCPSVWFVDPSVPTSTGSFSRNGKWKSQITANVSKNPDDKNQGQMQESVCSAIKTLRRIKTFKSFFSLCLQLI